MRETVDLPEFLAWRDKARDYLRQGVSPNEAQWEGTSGFLFGQTASAQPLVSPTVPPDFFALARLVACAREADRWALLYRIIYRLNHEDKNLLKVAIDSDVRRAQELAKSVSRDIHKMHAFVRFKKTEIEGVEAYVAWHQPEHLVLAQAAPFFVRRFGDKPWSIFTPDLSAHWNLRELSYSPGITQIEFDHEDPFDEVWKTYYSSIYNPARLKIKAMHAEMPSKYWNSLPEASIIRGLIRETPKRLQNMAAEPRYQAQVPEVDSWEDLREAAIGCRACPLAAHATQTVFGEGHQQAELMIVGEQPGDMEDLQGKIFVGPAGKILSDALAEAGIPRESVYITNAVKHFKFMPTEKTRLHKRATGAEMQACKPWLEAEIARVKPKVILALGVTAGTALYGRLVKIHEERGQAYRLSPFAPALLMSWHPAAILRAATEQDRELRRRELTEDLRTALQEAEALRLKS